MRDLLTYLERISPGFGATIEGAYPWYLEELEEIFGPVPQAMRDLSMAMGRSSGTLLHGMGSFETLAIRDLYSIAMQPDTTASRRYLFTINDLTMACSDYWLDLEQPHGSDDAA